jgi:hypothetical protein
MPIGTTPRDIQPRISRMPSWTSRSSGVSSPSSTTANSAGDGKRHTYPSRGSIAAANVSAG